MLDNFINYSAIASKTVLRIKTENQNVLEFENQTGLEFLDGLDSNCSKYVLNPYQTQIGKNVHISKNSFPKTTTKITFSIYLQVPFRTSQCLRASEIPPRLFGRQ